jgi:hypothetical protein
MSRSVWFSLSYFTDFLFNFLALVLYRSPRCPLLPAATTNVAGNRLACLLSRQSATTARGITRRARCTSTSARSARRPRPPRTFCFLLTRRINDATASENGWQRRYTLASRRMRSGKIITKKVFNGKNYNNESFCVRNNRASVSVLIFIQSVQFPYLIMTLKQYDSPLLAKENKI